jgi:hypothetical protein
MNIALRAATISAVLSPLFAVFPRGARKNGKRKMVSAMLPQAESCAT